MTDDEFLDIASRELDFLASHTVAEYRALPLPSPVDLRLLALCGTCQQATRDQRECLVSSLNEDMGGVLLVFVERMAMLSVRRGSTELLFAGLLAVVMIDGSLEPYDLLMVLSLPRRSAVLLGVEPRRLFAEAVRYATSESTAQLVLDFADRLPENSSLAVMGYRELQGPKGIVYWYGWHPVPTGLLE
jgi:hypothetical protein